MGKKILLIPALIFGVALSALSQFAIPTIWGADGYLHIRMAEFIRLYGLHYQFHWARYSTFYQHFADKDFLYHILLIPFTFLPDMFLGAKIAACIFVIVLFFIFYWVLKRYCLPALSPLLLLLFFLSAPFLRGISEPRPMVLVLALTLLLVHFLIRKNWRGLFFVSLIYTLTHVSGPYLIFYALLAEATRFIIERKVAWRSLLAVALGLFLGTLVHPNFPNNLLVFYINGIVVPYYAMHWGLELGAEFFPLDTRDFVLGYPFILIAVILLLALGLSRSGKTQLSTKIWMSITGFFFIFSFFSRRYFIHGYPLVLISLGAYLSDWWQSEKRLLWLRGFKFSKPLVALGLVGMLGFFGLHTYKGFRENAFSDLVYNRHFEMTAKWMRDNIPPGELIFHTNWSDSQYFIGLNPANDYFVTLDPTYMFCWDKDKYNLYREVSFGKSSDPYAILKNEFKVRYGYAGKNFFSGLITQIRADERFAVLAENDFGAVFKLK